MSEASAGRDRIVKARQDSPVIGPEWVPLQYLSLYRLLLSVAFVVVEMSGLAPRALGEAFPILFDRVSLIYLVLAVVFLSTSIARRPGFETQVVVQTFTDIVALTTLMHASGGVNSGFGMLVVVAVAGASVLTHGRIAILFAAMASLAVLTEQSVASLDRSLPVSDYTHAGLLGLTAFATAFLANFAARRVRISESLAASRAVDVANLAQLNEHIIERMQSGIVVVDAHLRVRRLNAAARQLLNVDDTSVARPMAEVLPALAGLRNDWLMDPHRSTYTVRVESADREVSVSFALLSADPRGEILLFVEDAGLMVQRAQALKLASLGRLAASIAHEIRNPLGAISHAGQLLAEGAELGTSERRLTEIIRTNAHRVDDIIESVLQLSRRAPSDPNDLSAEQWLTEFVREFRAETGGGHTVNVTVSPPDLSVRFDAGQLRQVMWNLCENSVRHGGKEVALALTAGVSPDGVRPFVEVADDGPGLDPDAATHLFEPFFTTRSDGTGLGLYLARELCEANQSTLGLRAGLDAGATFRITLADPRRQQAST